MFDQLRSFFKFEMKVQPKTGFLIASGSDPIDPTFPDISFVRTPYFGMDSPVPFIPGSSFKGVVRATSESMLLGLGKYVCDLSDRKKTCSYQSKMSTRDPKEKIYSGSCFACRLFGSNVVGSVIRYEDFFPFQKPEDWESIDLSAHTVVRNGIQIQRSTGSVASKALFNFESIDLPFYGGITMKNPELWQIGLFLNAIRLFNSGLQRLGHSKSRGMGKVQIEFEKLTIISVKPSTISLTDYNGSFRTKDLPLPSEIVEMGEVQDQLLWEITWEGDTVEQVLGYLLDQANPALREVR